MSKSKSLIFGAMRILLVMMCILASSSLAAFAQRAESDSVSAAPVQHTLLIINSYNESSPWGRTIVEPINLVVARHPDVTADYVYLNSTLINDSTTYEKVRQNVISNYLTPDVEYVVFVGNMAFTFRDDVRAILGDVPMLLITRDNSIGPTSSYFSGFDKSVDPRVLSSLSSLQSEYNFTAVCVPDLYEETIDMMARLVPDMEEFVYFSDAMYFNRYLSREIENYLTAEYPDVKFHWAKASYENADLLRDYLVVPRPNTGILLSSWFYETIGALGYPTLITGEMSLMSSSVNPVFTMRSSYLSLGAVGGVYTDLTGVRAAIDRNIDAMIAGESMRDINFYINRDSRVPTLNYPLYSDYKDKGMLTSDLPKDTEFVNRPPTFLQKYFWPVLIVLIVFLVLIYLLAHRNAIQRREIENLSRHKQFVDSMPIPYTKAKVIYNDYMNAILDVEYTMSNQAFDELISKNSDPKNQYLLFSPEFISEKSTEMIEKGAPVSFLYHFKNTDRYYVFTLCLVDSARKSKELVDTIDMFAIDVTSRQKGEEELKAITKRLDMVIDVANLIPWEWDPTTDVMKFDAYSMFHRLKRSFDDGHLTKGQSLINTNEYMRLVYPEDREKVRSWREKLLSGKIKEFDMEYRLVIARQNQEKLEWVDVRGAVTQTDDRGLPLKVMGSMFVITERKEQEIAVMEAQRKTALAEDVKASFVHGLSREVRIQLNAIVGFANLMSDTDDAEKRKEFVDIINTNSDQLLGYIDDMVAESSDEAAIDERGSKKATAVRRQLAEEAASEPVRQPKPDKEAPAEAPAQKQKKSARPLVLVAEDIEGNYLLLKHFIPKNCDVIHAWTGKEAVDMYNERHPDIILMDIGMPVMDGYKATSEIRRVDSAVPIVAVTAYTANSDRELILQSGFDDYISKPVMKDVLLETLKRYI